MKIGLVSDIHEDIQNLQNAILILRKQCDEIVCLGDTVGCKQVQMDYIAQTNATKCLGIVKNNCSIVVPGNHDLNATGKLSDYKAGIDYPENWHKLSHQNKEKLFAGKIWFYKDDLPNNLTNTDIEYLRNLSEVVVKEFNGLRILFTHYIFPDISGSLAKFAETPEDAKKHFDLMDKHNCNLAFVGHAHYEGSIVYTPDEIKHLPFGKYILNNDKQILTIPPVINSDKTNGFVIFDTIKRTISIQKVDS